MLPRKVKSLQKTLAVTSNVLLLTCGVILLLSFSTIFWNEASSTRINSSHNNFSSQSHSPDQKPFLNSSGEFSVTTVKYSYSAKGNFYKSKLLCICLPIGIKPSKNQHARYLPFASNISVLLTGPHLLLPLILFILGYGIKTMNEKLIAFTEK